MEIKKLITIINDYIQEHKKNLEHNETIFEILEGDLATHLRKKLNEQLSGDSSSYAMMRSAPINVLKKIIDKLSSLYTLPPVRTTENEQDQELIDWYTHELNINTYWNDANESFNAYKNFALDLFVDEGYLKTRSLRAGRYLAMSLDPVNPMRVTHFIKIMESVEGDVKFWVYSKDEFLAYDQSGDVVISDLPFDYNGKPQTENPFGVIPQIYQTRSRYLLVPKPDTDTIQMSLLIPVLMTDLNFASMFLSNPIVWTSNAKIENMKLSPNMYWDLKGEIEGEKPQIGVIKPEPNIQAQLDLVKDQLGMWLQTRNIKAGAIGKLTAENAASGISLMIQEMDTTEDRLNQIPYFKQAEQEYWYKLATIHNQLVNTKDFVMNKKFSDPEKLKVNITYSEQKPIKPRLELLAEIEKELAMKTMSNRKAIKKLNPDISDAEIDSLLKEIKEEESIKIPTFNSIAGDSESESDDK